VPDRIVIVRHGVWLVEVKTSDGKLSSDQVREHQRLTDAGARVRTVYGHQGVDQLIEEIRYAQTATTA
jgi:nucleotide-binding universal stress UspA family protein